jgi:hypothetical protein
MASPSPVNILYGSYPKTNPTINSPGIVIDSEGAAINYSVYGATTDGSGPGGLGGLDVTDYCYHIKEQPDSIRDTFTLRFNYVDGTTHVYYNGSRQTLGEDYDYIELGNKQVKFNFIPLLNSQIVVDYISSEDLTSGIFDEPFSEQFE